MEEDDERRGYSRRNQDRDLAIKIAKIESRLEYLERQLTNTTTAASTLADAIVQVRIDMSSLRTELNQTRLDVHSAATQIKESHDSERNELRELLEDKGNQIHLWLLALIPPIITGILVAFIVLAITGKLK